MKVLKFGGSSLADAARYLRVKRNQSCQPSGDRGRCGFVRAQRGDKRFVSSV